MARGGKREGAGRKQGSVSRVTQAAKEAAAQGGETPLDYMLRIMRDPTVDHPRRDDMAKAAGPYVHNRLSSVEHSGGIDVRRAGELSDDELAAIAADSGAGIAEPKGDPQVTH